MERPVELTPEDTIQIVGRFLYKEWKHLKPEDIKIDRIQAGNNNVIHIVSSDKVKKEPAKVAVRTYGRRTTTYKTVLDPATETEEIIIQSQLASQGLAPKIYGLFDDGRVEEFINCRLAKDSDLANPEFDADIGRNMARFHAVEVPLPRPKFKYIDVLRSALEESKEPISEILANPNLKDILKFISHDWNQELDFLEPLLDPSRHRIILMLWGPHSVNIGVRNNAKPGELKSFLFDYEMCCYNIRGHDTGHYLRCRHRDINNGDTSFPPTQECENFIKAYMAESEKLFDDWDPNGKDSFDHIMMESLVGGAVSSLEWLFFFLCHSKPSIERDDGKMLSSNVTRLYNTYMACKESLIQRYPDYQTKL